MEPESEDEGFVIDAAATGPSNERLAPVDAVKIDLLVR